MGPLWRHDLCLTVEWRLSKSESFGKDMLSNKGVELRLEPSLQKYLLSPSEKCCLPGLTVTRGQLGLVDNKKTEYSFHRRSLVTL
jgi:hypothetical protein